MDFIKSNIDLGLILIDRERLSTWKSALPTEELEPVGEFSIALDFRGKTDQVYHWPNEDWSRVWHRETQAMVQRVNQGELALLILHEGEFVVDLDIVRESLRRTSACVLSSTLHVPSGLVVVAEAGKLAEDWFLDVPCQYEDFALKEVVVTPGWYTAVFQVPSHPIVDTKRRFWRYGTEDEPAVIVRLLPGKSEFAPLTELFHVDLRPDESSRPN